MEEIEKKIEEAEDMYDSWFDEYFSKHFADVAAGVIEPSFRDYEQTCKNKLKELGLDSLYKERRMLLKTSQNYEMSDMEEWEREGLMTLERWKSNVEGGGFINYDGFGRYSDGEKVSNLYVSPSQLEEGSVREDFSHIVWYNR